MLYLIATYQCVFVLLGIQIVDTHPGLCEVKNGQLPTLLIWLLNEIYTPRVFLLRDEDTNSIDSGIPVSLFHALVIGCGGHHQAVMPSTKRIMTFSDKKKALSTQKLGGQGTLQYCTIFFAV